MTLEYAEKFDVAQGLYWYCANYHTGQWSDEYRVLSTLGYNPGCLERGPNTSDSRATYRALRQGKLTLDDVLTWLEVQP